MRKEVFMVTVKLADTGLEADVLESLPTLAGLKDAYRTRQQADALLVPLWYGSIGNPLVRALAIQARYGRVVRTDELGRLHTRMPVSGYAFVTGDPRDNRYYPRNDPMRPGQDRYDWYTDQNDNGIQYGFLKE
jgi:hypothetical protein